MWCSQIGDFCKHEKLECAMCKEWGPYWQNCEVCGKLFYGSEEGICEVCLEGGFYGEITTN